jgi:surfeit locus 1 family protein
VTVLAPTIPDGGPAPGQFRFLGTRRWVIGHLVVLLIVGGCVVAGFWQLDRLHQRRASNARIEARMAMPRLTLSSLGAGTVSGAPDALAYRRVEVSGRFDSSNEVVLVGRTLGDETGNNVLTPLKIGSGRGLLVDRGWIPYALQSPPVRPALPPDALVMVSGVLLPSESSASSSGGAETHVASIDIPALQSQLPYRLEPVYLWLQSQTPAQPGRLPRAVPLPPLSEGPHLSYAIQWFTFASIGVIGYPLLLRREVHRRSENDGNRRSSPPDRPTNEGSTE